MPTPQTQTPPQASAELKGLVDVLSKTIETTRTDHSERFYQAGWRRNGKHSKRSFLAWLGDAVGWGETPRPLLFGVAFPALPVREGKDPYDAAAFASHADWRSMFKAWSIPLDSHAENIIRQLPEELPYRRHTSYEELDEFLAGLESARDKLKSLTQAA